jgi:hypothetical protein
MTWTGLKADERPYRGAARLYAEYRYRPSEAFVRLLACHLGWSDADRVLDLGAGRRTRRCSTPPSSARSWSWTPSRR